MRIHIATDHAGLEFSTQLSHHLADAGPRGRRPRSGRLRRRSMTTRRSASAPRRRSSRDQEAGIEHARRRLRRIGQRRADRREQGARHPRRAGVEHRDRRARPRAQRRQRDRDRRAPAHVRRGRPFIDRFIATPFSDEERHVRRIAQIAAFETTGDARAGPARPVGQARRARADDSSFDPEAG